MSLRLSEKLFLSVCATVFGLVGAQFEDARADDNNAEELLRLALQCTNPPVDGRKTVYQSAVNGDVWHLMREIVQVWSATSPDEEILGGRNYSITEYFIALADIKDVSQDSLLVNIECEDNSFCVSHFEKKSLSCNYYGFGSPSCEDSAQDATSVDRVGSARSLSLGDICKEQRDAVGFGLRILIDFANQEPRYPQSFRVQGVPEFAAVPIRKGPGTDKAIVGSIASTTAALYPQYCKPVDGYSAPWCQIQWGGVSGYVSTKRLVPN
ncbi:SH3 domain-containing protein [Rhizobium leguminosarum]|uniref:SH3 domain-containing protein n=1 Tax=Rhizobium leguminosarum TaxID=384 RepID=UPI0014411E10|nr:hypothetical protein [Rhizobium leguminosarum]NKM92318.1 hypothetical protein [Rhizobium leguminosarum bv. viciae]